MDNLRQKVLDHARRIKGLDLPNFQGCLTQPGTKAVIDREIRFANENGIHATPTVFLNGKETKIVAPEQLRTLIVQLSRDQQALASAATR